MTLRFDWGEADVPVVRDAAWAKRFRSGGVSADDSDSDRVAYAPDGHTLVTTAGV